jgi:hypothetical protein
MMFMAAVRTNHRSRTFLLGFFMIFVLGLYSFSSNAQGKNRNSIVRFFDDAECQFETDDQRHEIEHVLRDQLLSYCKVTMSLAR